MAIPLTRTQDILGYLGQHRRPGQVLCGFSMETKDMLVNSRRKLEKKNLDLIAANNVKVPGAGFAVDTNVLTLITRQGEEELPLLSKEEAAHRLLDALLRLKDENIKIEKPEEPFCCGSSGFFIRFSRAPCDSSYVGGSFSICSMAACTLATSATFSMVTRELMRLPRDV